MTSSDDNGCGPGRRYAVYALPSERSRLSSFGDRAFRLAMAGWTPGAQPNGEAERRSWAFRKYGFHATLKAPFHLAEQASFEDLVAAVRVQAARIAPVRDIAMTVGVLDGFVVLRPVDERAELSGVAASLVLTLDHLRRPLSDHDRARRRPETLDARQRLLLERWGYPHLFEQYRFHMTLSGRLAEPERTRAVARLDALFADHGRPPLDMDAISLVAQDGPDAAFKELERVPLTGAGRPGTLFVIVGASGVGKDSVIDLARQRLPCSAYYFPKRFITRQPVPAREDHESLSSDAFAAAQAAGHFAVSWRANGARYALDRSVEHALAGGVHVVANVSRSVVERLRRSYHRVCVVKLSASSAVLKQRLAARGTETDAAIEARLHRHRLQDAQVRCDHEIANDARLTDAADALVALVRQVSAGPVRNG